MLIKEVIYFPEFSILALNVFLLCFTAFSTVKLLSRSKGKSFEMTLLSLYLYLQHENMSS